MNESRIFPIYALISMLMGYLATIIFIPKYISQHKTLQFTAFWGIVLSLGSYFTEGKISIFLVSLMGFGTAMLWGTIWGLSLRGLGRYTKIGGAMLLMGIIGGAILPLLFGKLVDTNPQYPQSAILLMIPFYLFILGYGIWGYKMEKSYPSMGRKHEFFDFLKYYNAHNCVLYSSIRSYHLQKVA